MLYFCTLLINNLKNLKKMNLLNFKRGTKIVTVVPGTSPEIPLQGELTCTPFQHQGKTTVFVKSLENKKWPTTKPFSTTINKIVID
jgi:hypothetical protein